MRRKYLSLILLVISTIVLSDIAFAESAQKLENNMWYKEYLLKEAQLPQIPSFPTVVDPSSLSDETLAQLNAWWEAKDEHEGIVIPNVEQIQEFACISMRKLAADHRKSNFLYSPPSLWFCLSTLSDLAEGNTQAQIQDVIGYFSEEQRDAVFKSLYWKDDTAVCIPAVSVWLDRSTSISDRLLEKLSAAAHSSVFQGSMGDLTFDQALQLWLNKQTKGLLQDSISDLRFSPNGGLSVCSSLYMKSSWMTPFDRAKTSPNVFQTETGDVMTDFMCSSNAGVVFQGDGFSATTLDFQDGGGVTFILPDTGRSLEDLMNGDAVFRFLFSQKSWDDYLYGKLNLSVPKMDCLSSLSLSDVLEKLGISDIFDSQKAQFSPELSSERELSVSDVQQYARLILNEEGVEAAAITLTSEGSSLRPPEDSIDFALNRPFMYAVMSNKGIPLFIGTYYTP